MTRLWALGIGIAIPILIKMILDTMVATSVPTPDVVQSLFVYVFWIGGLYISERIARRGFDIGIINLELRVMKQIYHDVFAYLHKHSYSFFADSFSGALVKQYNKLVYAYETIVDVLSFEFVPTVVSTIGMLIIIFRENAIL